MENLEFWQAEERRRTVKLVEEKIIAEQFLGAQSGGGTPGSIPNPVVKPVSADGTGGAAPWESRSAPRNCSFAASYRPVPTNRAVLAVGEGILDGMAVGVKLISLD